MTRDEESRIISAVLDGDVNAYEALVLEYQKSVYSIALRMTGSRDDAYDISQDAFLKAYKSLHDFRGECSFGSWVYRMAANMSIDYLRRQKRRHTEETVYLDDDRDGERPTEIPDMAGEPYAVVERREMRRAVMAGLERLDEEQRLILILRDIDGLSYAEIAETLKIEISTVKSRIYRARARLANFLLEKGNFFDKFTSNKREKR